MLFLQGLEDRVNPRPARSHDCGHDQSGRAVRLLTFPEQHGFRQAETVRTALLAACFYGQVLLHAYRSLH